MTIYLTSMADFAEMNGEYVKWFSTSESSTAEHDEGGKEGKGGAVLPARSCIAVKELPLGVPVEIECVALGPG